MKTHRLVALLLTLALICSVPVSMADERPTLTVLMAQNTNVQDYETNAFTKYVEDTMNVNLDFVLLPADGAGDKLSIMIMSGQELPDVVNYELDVTTAYRYAQTGAFIPLNDYYEQFGDNIKKCVELAPNILDDITCPDGNIYAVPMYIAELHDEHRHKLWINQKWLDALNLETPTTTEEFYNVLKAFKENDPNGNGIADEIPLAGSTSTQGNATITLMNSFIYEDNVDHLFVKDGALDAIYNKDAYKEGLTYIRRLVSEGLYDAVSFTQKDNDLKALLNNEEISIVGVFSSSSNSRIPLQTCPWAKDYVGLAPLTGPEGVCYSCYEAKVAKNQWFITSSCKNPELAFKVGDLMFDPTEEMYLKCRFGVENEHWSRPQEGDITAYPGFDPYYRQDVIIWGTSQNAHWCKIAPLFSIKAVQGGVYDPELTWYTGRVGEVVLKHVACDPEPGTFVRNLILNDEEIEAISEIRASLKSYVEECKFLFIKGEMSIENDWDSYVEQLDVIGVETFLEVAQEAYDRVNK